MPAALISKFNSLAFHCEAKNFPFPFNSVDALILDLMNSCEKKSDNSKRTHE